MILPQFQSNDQVSQMMQNAWAAIINPFLTNPSLKSIILPSVVLASGDTVINHKLGRKLQGWRIVRKRANANIYDKQDANNTPQLTLVLNSSAGVTVDIEVF